ADIERYDLGDARAAAAAYERVARLARGGSAARAGVYPPIADGALFALDTLGAAQPSHRRRLQALSLPLTFEPQNSDIASTIIPHLSAYGSSTTGGGAYQAAEK